MTPNSFRALALLASALISGCGSHTGGGFDASGPEMPRLAEALALRTGMVVADVGAGKGQLTPPFFFVDRSSLGIAPKIVIDEVTASGFEMLRVRTDWPGRGPFESYCALFRKPLRKQ